MSQPQTQYYVNGPGIQEMRHSLGFNPSAAYHWYTIEYGYTAIRWLVDGRLVRVVKNDGSKPFPKKPVYAYFSIWDASWVNGGQWAGYHDWSQFPGPYYMSVKQYKVEVINTGKLV